MDRKIRVLVAEDSPTVRAVLVDAFNATPDMRAVATVADGHEVVQAVRDLHPDVVTMDANMRRMDGLRATRLIMQECPVPIVIVSGILGDQVAATFRAMEAGALAFMRTPVGPFDAAHAAAMAELVETVRLMSEVKVVRRRPIAAIGPTLADGGAPGPAPRLARVRAVAIAASTGGPLAIRDLLLALPRECRAPILIVQHIAPGFIEGFGDWLRDVTGHAIHIARDGENLLPGHVYIAPDGRHLGLRVPGIAELSDDAPMHGLRPAVSFLFRAMHRTYGAHMAAALLSGMGKDGAQELLELKNAGALTFAQSSDSAIVFGMPGEAIRLDAARYIMTPAEIGAALTSIIG